MKVLGLSAFYHDAAAALVVDGRIVAAAQEERFSRVKHDAGYPAQAVAYCLREAGLAAGDLDLVAYYEKPLLKLERILETHLACAPASLPAFLRALPLWLKSKVHVGRTLARALPGYGRRCVYAEHHLAHAASAFLPSPFDEAAILTLDGVGEWATASVGRGRDGRVELVEELRFPHSLGLLYSAFTVLCGFEVNDGEYKLMGLAPYGEPRFERLIRERLIDLKDDGSFRLDQRWFGYTRGLSTTTPRLHRLLGAPPRRPEEPLTQHHMDLAASVQRVTEDVMLRAARHAQRRTGLRRLCLAGGVALNAVGNGRVRREGPFDEVWVQPAAGDAGGALGAALWAAHGLLGEPRRVGTDALRGARLGPAFASAGIRAELDRRGLAYEHLPAPSDLVERAAGLLAQGQVLGWFQGRMEWGPRALGSRSILADPRDPGMQSRVNRMIKFRESFRPFAPCVLAERAATWFDLPAGQESPYMLFVLPVAAAQRLPTGPEPEGLARLKVARSTLPAVTHVDGSARLQTVDAERDGLLHRLLCAFERRTGCPVLVNTSFNVKDEPIVCTPQDALACFERTALDALVLEDVIVRAPPGRAPAAAGGRAARAATRDALEGAADPAPPAASDALVRWAWLLPLAVLGVAAGWTAVLAGPRAWILALLSAGAAGSLALLLVRRWRAPALAAWTALAQPLGRLVSALLLSLVYLLLVTPVGLLLRALGRDPLERRLERGCASYWRPRAEREDPEAPFRRW